MKKHALPVLENNLPLLEALATGLNVDVCFPSFGRSTSDDWSMVSPPLELPFALLLVGIFWYTDNTVSDNSSYLIQKGQDMKKKKYW